MKETEVMDRLRSWTWWPFAVFAGATAIMFWRFVFAGHTLFAGDTAYVFLPLRMYGADRLGAGDLPLWNPCIFGGVPYLADPQTQLFYPLQVLFPLLGSPRAIGLSIPLHAFLACCTTYGFARRVLRLAPAAATVSGLLFGLGGLFQVRIEVPIYYAFLPWLPATLWATEVLRSRPTVVRFAIASVSFAMCLSTACIPSIFHLGQALAIRTFFRPKEDGARRRAVRERLRYLALLLGIIVAGAALALAALLPLTELAALSDRSFRPDYDFATNYSIRPLWLVSGLLLPTLYGSFQTPETFGFSMAPFTFYVGIIGVLLVGAAIVAPARHPWTRYSVVLSLLSCFLAIGRHNPVYPLLYRYVPGFAMFRGSSGILLLFALSLSCLAGVGANHLLSASTKERSRVARRACVLGLGMGVIMAILLTLGPRPDGQSDAEFGAGQSRQLLFLVLSLVVLLAVWRPRDLGRLLARSRTVAGLWIVLAVLDLCVFSQDTEIPDTLPVRQLDGVPHMVRMFPLDGARRVTLTPTVALKAFQFRGDLKGTSEREWRPVAVRIMGELLPATWTAAYNVNGLDGTWGALFPLRRKVPALYDNSPLLTQRPWYDLLGVRYFFAMTPKDIPDAELLRTAPLYAYLNEHAMSRAFLVHQARSWRPRGAPNAIVKRLAATPGVLPPVSQVLVEGHVPETTRRASPPAPAEAVPIRRYSAEVIDLDVNAPWPGFVVISDPPYPGWTVWVDGARKPALPADYVLRAVWVDAGPHHVRWVYYPASVRVGMFVSLATLAITVGLFVAAWRPGRRPKVRRKGPGRGDDSPPGGPHAGQSD